MRRFSRSPDRSRVKSRTTGWKPGCRTGRMPMFLLIQLREGFGIAHIGPFTAQLECFYFFSRLRECANRVGQFVLAARWRFQLCGKLENARPKCVNARVIQGA